MIMLKPLDVFGSNDVMQVQCDEQQLCAEIVAHDTFAGMLVPFGNHHL